MKCLTVLQPWAHAIVHGPKRVENRTWHTSHRGELLIHAGLSHQMLVDSVCTEISLLWPSFPATVQDALASARMDFGFIVGRAHLIDCRHVRDMPLEVMNRAGIRAWATGPYCWLLANVEAFATPIRWRGEQRLFEVPDSVVRAAVAARPNAKPPAIGQGGLFPQHHV